MDVSYTNVLEGARQYFQGLPTATCSTSNPAYPTGGEHQSGHYNTEQNPDRTPTSSYWPPQERSQPPREPQQRPPSHHSDQSRPSSHNQNQIQEQIRSSSSYHAPNSHQEQSVPTSHTYQFTRPHSREIQQPSHHLQQHQPQSQQYQSHIMPNPAYQQPTASMANRTPSRVPEMTASSSQTYHQLQQPQSHQPQQQSQAYSSYQQNRAYYPVHTQAQQSQYYNHSYQVASSQGYSQTQPQEVSYAHPYPSHSQNSYPNETTYVTPKPPSTLNQESNLKENQPSIGVTQNQQTSQPYRATHNLPPIAALSSLNYHSSRSREAIRIANNKPRPPGSSTSTSSSYLIKTSDTTSKLQAQQQYSLQNTHPEYPISQQNRTTVSQPYQCPPAVTYSNNQFTTTTSASMTTTSGVHPQPLYSHQESPKTYHIPNSKIVQPHSNTASVMKQKRESPLDLSVKTVRTSADSTLDDTENADQKRLTKYYQTGRPPMHSPMQTPPTSYPCDMYNNTYQRNHVNKSASLSNSGVPKVDFLPNFNVSALSQAPNAKVDNRRIPGQATCDNVNQRQYYDRKAYQQAVPPQPSSGVPRHGIPHTSQHLSSTGMVQNTPKKPIHSLPRIDFLPHSSKTSSMYAVPSSDAQRKRPSDHIPPVVPSKIQKVDVWRQTIDQQIEQRLSSYAKSRLQQEHIIQKPIPPAKQIVNGNCPTTPNQDRSKDSYVSYHRPQYNTVPTTQSYPNNSSHYNPVQGGHNQTYVPTPVAHQYPGYANHGSQQQQALYVQHSLSRTNSNPSLHAANTNRANLGGAADRRVLSLLRNSLEIKGAKEAQKKLEREQYKPLEHHLHHSRSDIQQPSTDVMAPLQPKPGLVGRHNMSPFAATSIFDQNSNTPPTYKFHLPKAIDSIKFDTDIPKDNRIINKSLDSNIVALANSNTDLDGLTAILAARIRTKAELKQVGSHYNTSAPDTNPTRPLNDNQAVKQTNEVSNGTSPPKLTREKLAHLPRRKLFNRCEDELSGSNNVPHRDKSGLRSSSETSVFDFPDSDSDTEMPVLERQSLLEMRRDRKVNPKPAVNEEIEPTMSMDISFDDACDKFMAQLKTGVGKKRGRRKKVMEADVLAQLENVVTRDKPVDDMKIEPKLEDDSDSDSDTPLINCKTPSNQAPKDESEVKETIEIKKEVLVPKEEMASDSGSDTDTETIKEMSEKLKNEDNVKKAKDSITGKGKSGFGDGTDFHPGWEEEVYKYKRSLRMPAALIHVTRPPQWHRLSTSLPDLDPCPNSPSPSENPDGVKSKIKSEPIDSDLDSNSNFSFSFIKNNYDSEEGSSSVKSVSTNSKIKSGNSILDRLMERCGARKRKRLKKKNEETPKIIEKSDKELELLPTPGLEVETINSKKIGPIIKEESALLGFRKKTIDNFKDTFINNSKNLIGVNEEFKTVIKPSRTRLETRVLKQKATIKEVFGEDRPASAPPVTCVDNTEEMENKSQLNISFSNEHCNASSIEDLKVSSMLENTKEVLKSKLLGRGRKGCANLLKSLATKKIISEFVDDDSLIKQDRDSKSETPSIDGDDYTTPTRRRIKSIRRKFSSGFDYIRKKKKQVKKENVESDSTPKPKRRGALPKATPESEQDIQREIKMWVMNKGIGETHLHRAARLGYTDITAYCLEKMDSLASPKDNAGYTPLHEACARGHLSIAKLLLLYGANVSESAQGGIRPLHEAAENGFVEIVRLLLSYGADPTLATYSGLTPLSLATEEVTLSLLQNHIADIAGETSASWNFFGPASCFDLIESGYDPLEDVPISDPVSDDEDVDFEISDFPLPNLYSIRGEAPMDRWILLQDLSNILRIKSRDALLKQICSVSPSTSVNSNYKSVLRELKMSDFLEQATCCQYMCVGEKINTRASKIALVKYSDKVKQLLGVDKLTITAR